MFLRKWTDTLYLLDSAENLESLDAYPHIKKKCMLFWTLGSLPTPASGAWERLFFKNQSILPSTHFFKQCPFWNDGFST